MTPIVKTIGVMRQKLSFFVFMPNGSWPSSSGLRGHRTQWFETGHNFFLLFFFVLYINFNLSDDVFEEIIIFFQQNVENWSMEKFEIFFSKS
jgi:hypothetical protein